MPETPRLNADPPDPHRIVTRTDFAQELTRLRDRARLTVRDVARKVGIPHATVGDYFAGRHLPSPTQDRFAAILRVCGVIAEQDVAAWLEALHRVRRAPGRRSASVPAPYKGLACFQPEDAPWFFGRESLTGALVTLLDRRAGVLAIVGPSGSGKSSLLRAGLIPAAGRPWTLLTPGDDPLGELARGLAEWTGQTADRIATALREQPDQATLLPSETRSALLVVDQFEEAFTAGCPEAERQAFIAALAAIGAAGQVAVVIGLRADFYAHALRYEELAAVLQDAQVVVGPMSASELRRAIASPAQKAGLELEDGLVELLLRDLNPSGPGGGAHEAGALPSLSHVLLMAWERSRHSRLTIADYHHCGGIDGAVARSADAVYAGLTRTQQRIARQILTRLVHVADDTGDTRRRAARQELMLDEDAPAVLDRFIGHRLITADTDTVEIAHEALLVAWPRLRAWLDEDRAWLRLHRRLTVAAEAWHDSGRDPGALLRGVRLAEVGEGTDDPRHADDLNSLEREFLAVSRHYQQAEARNLRRQVRRRRQGTALLVVLLLVTTSMAVVSYRLQDDRLRQRDEAVSRRLAVEAAELRGKDVALSRQLALTGYRVAPTTEARSSLLEAYAAPSVTRVVGPPSVMQTVAFAPGGRVLATGGTDRTVRLWSATGRDGPRPVGAPLTGHPETVYSVSFSPDGRWLASGSGWGRGHVLILWRLGGGTARPVPLHGPRNTVYSVAFSPDGRLLAVGSADRTVRLWNLTDPARPTPLVAPLTGPKAYVQAVGFSRDGRTLAAGSADGTVHLWNMGHPSHPLRESNPLRGPAKAVFSVAFSPDGRTLAAGSADKSVWLWRLGRDPHPDGGMPLTGPTGWVNSVAYSPGGGMLAAASSDGKLWLWDPATRTPLDRLPHPGPVTAVTFLAEGFLATSAADGTARIWDLPGPVIQGPGVDVFATAFASRRPILAVAAADNTARLWRLDDPRHPVPLGPVIHPATPSGPASGAGALDPDATTLAIGGVDGSTQLWDIRTPARPVPLARLTGPSDVVQGITFSPTGRLVAVAGNDRRVWLWDVADPHRPVRTAAPVNSATNYAYQPAFSNDGRLVAFGSADTKVHLWDIADPRRPVLVSRPLAAHSAYVFTVAFSPDGRILASGGADNKVVLWDLRARPPRAYPTVLTGPRNYVYSLAYDHTGTRLAATAGDGTIWVWDVADPRHVRLLATISGASQALYVDAFAPSHPVLATAGVGRTVRLWNIDPEQVATHICASQGTPITRAEWRAYLPDHPYKPPCR